MTVSYTAAVANASNFGVFTSILIKWRGSVYKLVYKELLAFLAVYFVLNIFYRTVLSSDGMEFYKNLFESLKAYCSIQMSSIPMTFVLGFYVSLIVKRWWDQYNLLPWPDSLAIFIVGNIHGIDDKGRLMRRNIMRYVLLAYVITLRRVSFRVKKRFPTIDHVIEAGLMRSDELKCMESLNDKCSVSKWWMPLVWATNIVVRAREENRIKSDPAMQTILQEISRIRSGLTGVQHYDTISVPLVYTQVVSLAVYSYFLAALMGAQWVGPEDPQAYASTYKLPVFRTFENGTVHADSDDVSYQKLDLFYPFFLTLQFAFYVGWLKVAETLINPFGEDDDDFELNYLIDRHVQVSYMIVDDMHQNNPELLRDVYWNQVVPTALPYTVETAHYRKDEPKGSAENKDENDVIYGDANKSQVYPLFSVKLSGSRAGGLDLEPSSDYEAVDTNFIGWWKNKIRKSQIRRSIRSMSSNVNAPSSSAGNGVPPHPRFSARRRSSKSAGGGIYAKLMSVASSRSRKASLSSLTSIDGKRLVMAEDSIRSQADIDSDLKMIYGEAKVRPVSPQAAGSRQYKGELDPNVLVDRLNRMSHLSTITENSPQSTHMGSRRNSHHPSAAAVFDSHDTIVESNTEGHHEDEDEKPQLAGNVACKKGNDVNKETASSPTAIVSGTSSESPYYPMGSEMSRPFTPRFICGEEVSSNYEPVLVTNREFAVSPVVGASPILPKRLARMELDAIINKRPFSQQEKLPEVPEVVVSLEDEGSDEEEEVFEEIETPKEEETKTTNDNARSAFDNPTFYV